MKKRGPKKEERFIKSHIITTFRKKAFDEIPKHRLTAFLTGVVNARDEAILDSWVTHFRGLVNGVQTRFRVPFVITQHPKTRVKALWKEAA